MSIESVSDAQRWADRLAELGLAVQQQVVRARASGDDLAAAVAEEGGDTIFAIDRHVEPIIEATIAGWLGEGEAVDVVAEGFGEHGRVTIGNGEARHRLLIDPIDGTRNIMYDKRSAWFIACVALNRGHATRLGNAFASAMVELPPSKQGLADVFTAVRGQGVRSQRMDLRTKRGVPLTVRPSEATTLRNGFAQVANFFPGTKLLASGLMEDIAAATLGDVQPGQASIFEDQYIATAGQMVELMAGHDRFCCDLRPLFYRALEHQSGEAVRGLECHPYDLAGMLVAEEAGVVLTDGFGRPLDGPFDVHDPVHWCGYANEALRAAIEPVIQRFLEARGVTAD